MPYYDLKTKKIVGCKKNTLAWWHEDRHKQQHSWFPIIETLLETNFLISLFTIIFLTKQTWLCLIPIFLLLLLEGDAWGYSLGKWLKCKTQN